MITQSQAQTAAGDFATLRSNVINVNSVPSKMYIYAKKSNSEINFSPATQAGSSDVFGSIQDQGLQILWNNNQNLFSAASQSLLYQMCVRNGAVDSFPSWSGNYLPDNFAVSNVLLPGGPVAGSGSCICVY